MDLATRALWIIDRNLAEAGDLDWIAERCQASRFHLAHAFASATGIAVMTYVRQRRLTLAAQGLAAGAPDILNVALDAGYGSHEAFTRAFRTQFARTPEQVRADGCVPSTGMVDILSLNRRPAMTVKEPRIEDRPAMIFIGLTERQMPDPHRIGDQWRRFMERIGEIPEAMGAPVGVALELHEDGSVDYCTATPVARSTRAPKGLSEIRTDARTYAIFTHEGHVADVGATYDQIWNHWIPKIGAAPAEAPWLEIHLPTFSPQTGMGGVEIWVPVSFDRR